MTAEEVKNFVSDLRREHPDLVRELFDKVEETVELKKKELEAMRVIDMILQAGHILSDKHTLLNSARLRAFSKKLEHAQLLNLSETDEIEKAIIESNKIIQNPELEILHSICQEMVIDFFEKLEMYLDILGESPEGGALNPLQPYTLQLTPAEKKLVVDSVEMMEGLTYRGEQLSKKFKTFITSNAERVISYHYELLYFQSLLEMKKAIQLAGTVRNDLDELNESKHAKTNFVNETSSLSQAQWVLIYYYFFKHSGIDPRKTIDISTLAKFIHLATGIKFTTVQNSDIYQKLKKVPNFKVDNELLKDLKKIRPIFANHGLNDILQLIDIEIVRCKKKDR